MSYFCHKHYQSRWKFNCINSGLNYPAFNNSPPDTLQKQTSGLYFTSCAIAKNLFLGFFYKHIRVDLKTFSIISHASDDAFSFGVNVVKNGVDARTGYGHADRHFLNTTFFSSGCFNINTSTKNSNRFFYDHYTYSLL